MNPVEADCGERKPKSAEIQRRGERVIPGGDTGSGVYHQSHPLALERGDGGFIWDANGNLSGLQLRVPLPLGFGKG